MAEKQGFPKIVAAVLAAMIGLMSLLFWFDWALYEQRVLPQAVLSTIPPPVQWLENIVYDITVARIGGTEPDARISIGAIDDETVTKLGWPFSRRYHAQLIDRLKSLGAKTIVFDVMFLDQIQEDPAGDRLLEQATKRAGNVIHAGLVNASVLENGISYSFRRPTGLIGDNAFILANPNVDDVVDRDGHIRRIMLFYPRAYYDGRAGTGCKNCKGIKIASLSVAAYANFTGEPVEKLFQSLRAKNIRWINFALPDTYPQHPGRKSAQDKLIYASYPHVSVLDILDGTLSDVQKARIKDGIVFIGSTSLGTFDHYPTPFHMTAPGVELHANSLDNLLNNNYMRPASPLWSFAAMLFFMLLPLVFFRKSPYMGATATAAAALCWSILYGWLNMRGVKIYFAMPMGGLMMSFLYLTVYRVVVEGREKRWIKNTFGQYLSPKVVEVLMKDPDKLKLGGEKRDMSVFFLDIAHFTTISEKMDPEQLTLFLNKYLSALTGVILKNEGVVDKYIGDCIMAFWNAPLDLPEHRMLAALSAVECIETVERLNRESTLPVKPAVRIGLNAGNMVVGNMGSDVRFSYTVIGDEVNLASRLEGANKYFGSRIMASEAVYGGARQHILARELGYIRVVGKSIPILVHELIAPRAAATPAQVLLCKLYGEANTFYREGKFAEALTLYKQALEAVPGDAVCETQIKRVETLMTQPVPKDWDGVYNLTSK